MEAFYPILILAGRFMLATGLLMALYWLMWRKQATYRAKRIYLLTMPLVALAIALLQVEVYQPDPVVITVEQTSQALPVVSMKPASAPASETSVALPVSPVVTDVEEAASSASVDEAPLSDRFQPWHAVALVYTLILIGLCLPLIVGFVHLHFLRKKASVQKDEQNNVRIWVGEAIKAPFSFHRSIYLPQNLTDNQRRMILTHEQAHIFHRHYVDVWISSVVTRLMWWNPFLWWAQAELRNVHEFEADSVVLGTGEDVYAYQAILIEEVLHGDIVIANGFNHSFIRRRFIEMVQTSNRKMSAWAKTGSMVWMMVVVALMCCTVGEAETVYRTVTVDAPQPVVTEVPSMEADGVDSMELVEESLLADWDMLLEDTLVIVPVDSSSQTSDAIGYALPFNQSLKNIIPLLDKEQADVLGNLLNTLGTIHEITPEQYEAWQNESSDTLPNLDDINSRVKWIKDDLNNQFTQAINDLLFRLTRTQISGLVNTGLIDSLGTEKFVQPISNLPQTFDAQSKMVSEFIFEWCIYPKDVTPEEYQRLKGVLPNPELLPSLEKQNKDRRDRREKRVNYLLMQIKKMDESVGKQLEDYIAQYGIRPEEEYMELSVTFKDGREVIYQKEGNRFSSREAHEHNQFVIPSYEKAIKNLRKAKENEFVIEGFVDENITDSCYNIYIGDKYLNIDGDNPVATVPVVNKRFTYVMNLDKMTSGRVRCIFPGGKLCDNWIGLHFVPGETVILSVHNGFYNLEKSPAYNQKVNKAIDALREETNWETPHLSKIEGEAWKDVSHKDNGALIVKEVYFNDEETVLRLASEHYAEGMCITEKSCLVDEDGNRYRFKRAVTGNVNGNNGPEARVFGAYFAFEPMPKDTKVFSFEDHGLVIERIRKAKKGKIIY